MIETSSSGGFPDSPMESDDAVYPCKGCGEILEEGKAFELANHRWHLECFRCNTCGTILDSDTHLLLLGDGTLICNNCTYSCSACGDKIEDLAILTGDQAFCASCFRCRNCKRKIENLRYARTSQGIFCMECHESLMQRRRKRSKAGRHQSSAASTPKQEKSLPALPPSVHNGFPTPDTDASFSETYPDSANDVNSTSRSNTVKPKKQSPTESSSRRDASPSSYRGHDRKDLSGAAPGADEGIFIPLALDPNTAPGPSPNLRSHPENEADRDLVSPSAPHDQSHAKDYVNKGGRLPSNSSHREALKENTKSSRDTSRDRDLTKGQTPSPHIFSQEKGRQSSAELGRRKEVSTSNTASPSIGHPSRKQSIEGFKLQEVPKAKKSERSNSGSEPMAAAVFPDLPARVRSPQRDPNMASVAASTTTARSSESSAVEHPVRGESLSSMTQALSRKSTDPRESPATPTNQTLAGQQQSYHRDGAQAKSTLANENFGTTTSINGKPVSKPQEQAPMFGRFDATGGTTPTPPLRAGARPNPSVTSASDSMLVSRHAPPATSTHKPATSVSTVHSVSSDPSRTDGTTTTTGLPRYSGGTEFNLDEDMARILKGEDADKESVLKRVGNAVSKHGRSFSDRGSRSSSSSKLKGMTNGSVDISSPTSASPEAREDPAQLRHQLRRAQQRIAELETEKNTLLTKVNRSADIKQVNTELSEKRSTMTILDAQREMVVRELEAMTEQLSKAKDGTQPLDLSTLKSDLIGDLSRSLEDLKANLGKQIEELVRRRNELTDEIANLIQMKDKGFSEYESLSTKNHQLNELNNQLVHNIQEMYKASRSGSGSGPSGATAQAYAQQQQQQHGHHLGHMSNFSLGHGHSHSHGHGSSFDSGSVRSMSTHGLGIYQSRDGPATVTATAAATDSSLNSAATTLVGTTNADGDHEPTVLPAPQVVNIRKGQAKKPFNWRKGGQGLAKNVKQGLRGAFDRVDGKGREGALGYSGTEGGMPYGAMPAGAAPVSGTTVSSGNGALEIGAPMDVTKNGFDMNTGQKTGGGIGGFLKAANLGRPTASTGQLRGSHSGSNLGAEAAAASPSTNLFGSDLQARCDFEKRVIPAVVCRCVEEVELRGMDVEGIYRKSGGTGQVNAVRAGFEANNEYDISDPELDIHAVTSALKQFFRRMPIPLITYDTYDPFLEAGNMQDKERRVIAMRNAIDKLPRSHRDTLEFMVFHLARVMTRERENLMTSLNLAVVFAPTLLRPADIQREMSDMQPQRNAMQTLLENSSAIFGDE